MGSPAAIAAELLDEVGLAEATQHARAGRFAEAEMLLTRLRRHGPASAAQLDLLARIRAQQGDAQQAEALWDQALALDPGREDYRAARERVRGGSPRLGRAAIAGLGLALVVGAAGASAALLTQGDPSARPLAPTPPVTSLPVPGTAQDAAAGSLLRTVRSTLTMPGIDVRPRGAAALVVTFDDGLFASGIQLTEDARGLLTRVGRRLKPFAGRAAVKVNGVTDDIPGGAGPFETNAQLRAARAAAVQTALRARAGLPASMVSAGGARDARPPYPNTTADGRRRNRTAVLVIASPRP